MLTKSNQLIGMSKQSAETMCAENCSIHLILPFFFLKKENAYLEAKRIN